MHKLIVGRRKQLVLTIHAEEQGKKKEKTLLTLALTLLLVFLSIHPCLLISIYPILPVSVYSSKSFGFLVLMAYQPL